MIFQIFFCGYADNALNDHFRRSLCHFCYLNFCQLEKISAALKIAYRSGTPDGDSNCKTISWKGCLLFSYAIVTNRFHCRNLQPPLRRSDAMVALATLLHVTCLGAPPKVRVRTSYDIRSNYMFYQQYCDVTHSQTVSLCHHCWQCTLRGTELTQA